MRKAPILALAGPLLLIGAAYPDLDKPDRRGEAAHQETITGPTHYRPCRPGAGDDRCIQLYERGVRAAYAQWLRERDAGPAPARLAMGGPVDARVRPRRLQRSTPPRCTEQDERAENRDHRPPGNRPPHLREEREIGHGAETRGM